MRPQVLVRARDARMSKALSARDAQPSEVPSTLHSLNCA